MEQAIKKAIEGGYKSHFTDDGSKIIDVREEEDGYEGKISIAFFNTETDRFYFNKYQILLDPEFWKSLGKSGAWKVYNDDWKQKWHAFIEHLASGGDIDNFFKDLLTPKE